MAEDRLWLSTEDPAEEPPEPGGPEDEVIVSVVWRTCNAVNVSFAAARLGIHGFRAVLTSS
jgi:hypothetical protein